MATSLNTAFKAEAIAAAIQAATGERPDIVYRPDGTAQILFTENAAKNIRSFLEKQAAKKSDIDISFLPVIAPLIIKKTWPFVAGAAGLFLLIGYLAGRK